MTWSFDMSTAPRGKHVTVTRKVKTADGVVDRSVDEFAPEQVWLASSCGKVIKSSWVPANGRHNGYWSGFAQDGGTPPIAWHPYVIPAHPGARTAVSHKINLPIIDDVGGGA